MPGELPAPAVAVGGAVIQASAGDTHTCALLDTKKVRCWGAGGTIGYGDLESKGDEPGDLPTPDLDLGADVAQLAVGPLHSCVRTVAGGLRCWGAGASGGLGYGDEEDLGDMPGELPPLDVDGVGGVKDFDLGYAFVCAAMNSNEVLCWGANNFGQLGHGDLLAIGDQADEMPPVETPVSGAPQQVAAGESHVCVLMTTGDVHCWGEGTGLGYGTGMNVGDMAGELPSAQVQLGGIVKQIAAGRGYTCALMQDGEVRCWGDSYFGQLGYGDMETIGDEPGEMPPPDVALGGQATMIAAHAWHTCALLVDGRLRCWGNNASGQLGLGNTVTIGDSELPDSVEPVPF
jgi:alpha-tubulin suppressor-like RCC1 family protein